MRISNTQLKEFLLDAEYVDPEVVEENFREAENSEKTMGDLLLEKKLIDEDVLRKLYSYILGIPFVNLEKTVIDPDILHIIPEPIAKKNNVVAFEKSGESLKIAMLNPDDIQTIDFIQKKTGIKVVSCLTGNESMKAVLKQYEKSLKAEFGNISEKENEIHVESEKPDTLNNGEDFEKIDQNISVVKIVDTLLKHAILEKASDIHIEPAEKESIVRYRIDGILHDAMILPKKVMPGIVARIKVLSNLKLDEHRLPQDGRFKVEKNEYKISFRISILPVFDGEKIVMRLLDESSKGLTLERMGFAGRDLDVVHREIKKPNGMILVTGPTGSGKTTTLYTIMDIINTPEVNISTVEDPVEYRMPRINQTQTNSKIGMTFAAALRALLRQDPDIIMVGEIRDGETMEIAIHAAMTGHLVLSTLHTNSAAATIPRLLDMGAEPFLVASTVNVIIAQRLVRRLCVDCRKSYTIDEKQLVSLQDNFDTDALLKCIKDSKVAGSLVKSWKDVSIYKAVGCVQCGNEGYKGRSGIYEVMEITEPIEKLITERATSESIEKIARAEGMRTMAEDGMLKVIQGTTSIEEVLRVTKE